MKYFKRTWGFGALGWYWSATVGNSHGVLLGVTAEVSRGAVVLGAHCAVWSIAIVARKVTNYET